MFLLTDSSYGGLGALAASKGIPKLGFAPTTIKTGNGTFTVYGLNLQSADLPQDLKDFATPIVIWQDQRNSTIQYDSDGYVKSSPSCGGDGADKACPTGNDPRLTELIIKGGSTSTLTTLTGLVYQPRGAWTEIHSTINFAGGLALVTGALDMQGSPTLTLTGEGLPITTLTSVLVH